MQPFAVVSDIHGNLPALRAVAADIEKRKITTVFNLGDHLSGPLWPRETAMFLMEREWTNLQGNHDRRLARDDPSAHGKSDAYAYGEIGPAELAWLESLVPRYTLGTELAAFHGTPTDDSAYLLEEVSGGRIRLLEKNEIDIKLGTPRANLVLCGHSHLRRCVRMFDGTLVINPGSVGLPAYRDDGSIPHVVETGSPHARYAVVEDYDGTLKVEFVLLEYDWEAAAKKAADAHRHDWEHALRTGFAS